MPKKKITKNRNPHGSINIIDTKENNGCESFSKHIEAIGATLKVPAINNIGKRAITTKAFRIDMILFIVINIALAQTQDSLDFYLSI